MILSKNLIHFEKMEYLCLGVPPHGTSIRKIIT
jgi:hypothetical protein